MSGFEVYNSAGNCSLTHKTGPPFFLISARWALVTDKGFYRVDSPFGDGSTLGYTQQNSGMTEHCGGLNWM